MLAFSNPGNQMPEDTEQHGRTLYLKYWHIVFMLAIQLLALAYTFGKLNEGIDDLSRRVAAIENNKFVERSEFDDWKGDFRNTLERIESEIVERNKAERELQ